MKLCVFFSSYYYVTRLAQCSITFLYWILDVQKLRWCKFSNANENSFLLALHIVEAHTLWTMDIWHNWINFTKICLWLSWFVAVIVVTVIACGCHCHGLWPSLLFVAVIVCERHCLWPLFFVAIIVCGRHCHRFVAVIVCGHHCHCGLHCSWLLLFVAIVVMVCGRHCGHQSLFVAIIVMVCGRHCLCPPLSLFVATIVIVCGHHCRCLWPTLSNPLVVIYTLYMTWSGLVQLEALEMLNSTTEQKVRQLMEMLSKDSAESLKSELIQIKQVFDDVEANSDDGRLLWLHMFLAVNLLDELFHSFIQLSACGAGLWQSLSIIL